MSAPYDETTRSDVQCCSGGPGGVLIAALYRFVDLGRGYGAHEGMRGPILAFMRAHGVMGTLILAHEGINGTVAGPEAGTLALIEFLKGDPMFHGLLADLEPRLSRAPEQPFNRTKVRLKREIVTMGVEDIDPTRVVGTYVEPEEWNALIDRDDVLLIDTRNGYEYGIGTFESADERSAVDPGTGTFREFPAYVDAELDPQRHKKVAMFCTGGIRCEKATAYLKQRGFGEVYHLRGGILKYLERIPAEASRWRGECFVFDDRVAVGNGLKPGSFVLCYGCRMPVHVSQVSDPRYEEGVSCPACFDEVTPERRARLAERHRQVAIAEARGGRHIGDAEPSAE